MSEHVKVCLCIQVLAHECMYTTVQYVSNLKEVYKSGKRRFLT